MTLKPQAPSPRQLRRAYKLAVEATLIEIFNTPKPGAKKIVASWWGRVSVRPTFNSGLFMHNEVINTAADLIKADDPGSSVNEIYRRILAESYDRVLHSDRGETNGQRVVRKIMGKGGQGSRPLQKLKPARKEEPVARV